MIDFDRFVFGGDTPTEWLQANINQPGVVNGWDVAFTLVYTSYFIVPFALAGVLWIRDRARLPALHQAPRHARRSPGSPPTSPSRPRRRGWRRETGLLDGVQRTTSEGWEVLGGGTAGLFSEGQTSVNLVAAVPSLHSAFTALVAMFLWGRVRPILRPLRRRSIRWRWG